VGVTTTACAREVNPPPPRLGLNSLLRPDPVLLKLLTITALVLPLPDLNLRVGVALTMTVGTATSSDALLPDLPLFLLILHLPRPAFFWGGGGAGVS